MFVDENQFFYVYTYNSAKEMWDTLKMMYEVFQLPNKREWTHEVKKMNAYFINVSLPL